MAARMIARSRNFASALLAGAGLVALCSPVAVAQEAQDQEAQVDAPSEELIVTARRREERLIEVPISISAFGTDRLDNIGVKEINDILLRTPNFYQPYLGEAKGSPPSIRGITANSTAGSDPAVAFYVDEVYLGNTVASSFDYFALERIEVLRGPQGTLYGRNSMGGAVSVATRGPSETPEGDFQLGLGNYNAVRATAFVSGPLADQWSGALAFSYNDRDGFIENTNPAYNQDPRSWHNYNVRAALQWRPSPDTEFTLRADYRDLDQHGGGYKADAQNMFFQDPLSPLYYNYTDPFSYEVSNNCCIVERLEAGGVSLVASHDLGWAELKSITAYREHDYFSEFDSDLSPNDWLSDGSPETLEQISQEVRLTSPGNERLNWIAGFFYYRGDSLDRNFITLRQDILPVFGAPPGTPNLTAQANGHQIAESYAAYVHADYQLTDRLQLSGGARFTFDDKSIDYEQADPAGLFGGGFAYEDEDTQDALTGDLTLRYSFTDNAMIYATASRGYKAGGFNDGIGVADNPPFLPEYLDNYEIGAKGEFFDGRLSAAVSVFHLQWSDIQVAGFDFSDPLNIRRITGNFGAAQADGFEIEIGIDPTENWNLGFTYGAQDGAFEDNPGAGIVNPGPITGPEYKWGAWSSYSISLGGERTLEFYGDVETQGPNDLVNPSVDQTGLIVGPHQDTFSIYNGRITYRAGETGYRISLWGNNLSDETYRSQYFYFGSGTPILAPGGLALNAPRTYGVEIGYSF